MVGPLQCFDVRGFGRDESEEVDDLCAVGIDDLDCLSLLERHGNSGTRGDDVFLAGWVGGDMLARDMMWCWCPGGGKSAVILINRSRVRLCL